MLLRAFPKGVPEEDYLALVALLYDEMSHRALATVLSHLFETTEYHRVLNDIGFASRLSPQSDPVLRVRGKLVAAGYEEWLKEEPC